MKQSSFVVQASLKNKINKITYLKDSKRPIGEIIGINKISKI